MSRNYKFHNPEGLYFVSFATVFWVDVFVRRLYFDCLVENLNHCVEEKGMEIYAWCIMSSHVHLVFKSTIQKPDELIRDFKSYTSKKLIALIADNTQESRREWLLNSFKKAALTNSNNAKNQFWQQHNNPIELWSNDVIQQKIDYTHNNPVEAGFVESDYEYLYSSARDYCDIKGLVKVIVD
ncbi:REP-associated tyrosine transposase [Mucilaginibacter sp. X4EP1]|uniref:REP-associated tyrosine transposase n=1 Tax=Mucilaginibacter sp. X4EP1 TaxID=2723092 RepID=UPI002168E8CA|nr:transposase [Mucilaginibacter sp. X4EP1]MCS3814160.1 REP element-mobilizing transposase RayT [Mucilaginibacter sp. X4EP1]